jgi:hypothetical protein
MGGFGSGGSRSGAGRKKKATHLRGIDGGAGRRGPAVEQPNDALAAAEAPSTPPSPPPGLGPTELAIWMEWAPLATDQGTLTASTLANFAQLCQAEADRRELRDRYTLRYDEHGQPRALLFMGSKEELAIRREHRTLLKDIHARMKDFMIAPFGKELGGHGAGAGEVDPLDQFTRKQG